MHVCLCRFDAECCHTSLFTVYSVRASLIFVRLPPLSTFLGLYSAGVGVKYALRTCSSMLAGFPNLVGGPGFDILKKQQGESTQAKMHYLNQKEAGPKIADRCPQLPRLSRLSRIDYHVRFKKASCRQWNDDVQTMPNSSTML